MCGRYVIKFSEKQIQEIEELANAEASMPDLLKNRYNVAPTQQSNVVTTNKIRPMQWGLIPSWSKNPQTNYSTFNARSETIAQKATYKDALLKRRGILPISGYYEWKTEKSIKTPYYVFPGDEKILYVACIWETWMNLDTYSIITCAANTQVSEIHHRMPVVLNKEDVPTWMNNNGLNEAHKLMKPTKTTLSIHPVSISVNKTSNNDPTLINSVTPPNRDQLELF